MSPNKPKRINKNLQVYKTYNQETTSTYIIQSGTPFRKARGITQNYLCM